ncbi:hypothetical protein R9C00_07780 [Flammeovirgaceae bacterium SG7u.111]|nr:hypothetical protein [Flammeovirgaceae bacterium SG7u.132]WPO37346.1 hypothetical protein R9C00_07780 [Flammeovirgaceae bacterium SG7u.111]
METKKPLIFFILFIFSSLTTSCGGKQVLEEEFDSLTWKNDKLGCNNERFALVKQFQNIRPKLMGKQEGEIRKLLGSPDQVELYERSQKFYIYYIEKGSQCEGAKSGIASKNFYIRFNSLNQVSEITQQNF